MINCLFRRVFACFFLIAFSAQADQQSASYTIADIFPYGWHEAGEPKGLLVDIAKAVDRELGVSHSVSLAPVSRVMRSIESGEYDFTIVYRGDKLNRKVDHLLDVGCVQTAAMSMQERPINTVTDMNGMRIAHTGSGYFVDTYLPALAVHDVQVSNVDIMFRMALRGRLDAFIIDDAVLQSYRKGFDVAHSIPNGGWREFARPFYLENMRVSLTSSQRDEHKDLKVRMRSLQSNTGFIRRLQKIYDFYGLTSATDCLQQPDTGGYTASASR